MILFFDTETTGLPKNWNAPASDVDNWPRLVQLAWCLDNKAHTMTETYSYIVKPEGFTIPFEVAKVHGITQERAMDEGFPLEQVLDAFVEDARHADVLVAHNIEFDRAILSAEFARANRWNACSNIKLVCTMKPKAVVNHCGALDKRGRIKWPKLMELHQKLFGEGFEGAHDAKNDVLAGVRCYWKLCELGLL